MGCIIGGLSLFIILMILAAPVKVAMDLYHHKSLPDLWGKFADKNGLTLIPGKFSSLTCTWPISPVVTGKYRNLDYRLSLGEVCTSDESCNVGTVINISLPVNIKWNFYIYQKSLLNKMMRKKNFKEVLTGDPEFDKVFTIESNMPGGIDRLLTPELKHKMLYDRDMIVFSFDGQNLHYDTIHLIRDPVVLEILTDIMGELATSLSALGTEIQALPEQRVSLSEWICPSCNTSVSVNSIYCINCGTKKQT